MSRRETTVWGRIGKLRLEKKKKKKNLNKNRGRPLNRLTRNEDFCSPIIFQNRKEGTTDGFTDWFKLRLRKRNKKVIKSSDVSTYSV